MTNTDKHRPASAAVAMPPVSLLHLVLLSLAVAVAGASVMVIELLGTRVLAPVFGSSLYVWTALISITLVSLTIGYPLGGAIADRRPSPRLFFTINAAAGLAVLLSLVIRGPVLNAAGTWGFGKVPDPRVGTLGASLVLFTLPLVLLGMVGPFAAKLFVQDVRHLGRTIGSVSALSAGGSIIGSIATGFVLIPHVSISNILLTVSAALLGIGALGLAACRGYAGAGGAAAAFAALLLANATVAAPPPIADPRIKVLFEGSSAYGDVKVVDLPHARFLFIGHLIQTIDSPNEQVVSLSDLVHLIPAMRPEARRVLLIGMAGGTKVKFLLAHGLDVDAIEIDPLVVQVARDYFGIREGPRCRIFVEDGRTFLNRCDSTYDAIILDAFGGGTAPVHLFSVEAIATLKQRLAPGGIMMMNCMWSPGRPSDRTLPDILRTIDAGGRFAHRRVYAWIPQPGEHAILNYLTFASDRPLDFARPLESLVPERVAADLRRCAVVTDVPADAATVITDDLNPLDVAQIPHNDDTLRDTRNGPLGVLFDPRR